MYDTQESILKHKDIEPQGQEEVSLRSHSWRLAEQGLGSRAPGPKASNLSGSLEPESRKREERVDGELQNLKNSAQDWR